MRTPKGKAIAAGMIGNVSERDDFAIYGYFAASIGRHFFPREDPVAQLLAAFGVFAFLTSRARSSNCATKAARTLRPASAPMGRSGHSPRAAGP